MRKNVLKTIALLLVLIGFTHYGKAQSGSHNEREKIYIQIDKPFFRQKDIVWFNLIVLDAKTHYPTKMSDVVYAELIDPKGTVLKKLTLPVSDGTAKGDFELPNIGGIYRLKAYTSWSKNFNDISLLERKIPVQNVITTRLLLKPDFDKKSYAPGDNVYFDLNVRTLKNEAAAEAEVSYSIQLKGEEYATDKLKTDAEGNATLKFQLSDSLATTDALINVLVSYDGLEESVARTIPIILNNIDVKFYPEGGHPTNGHESTIAFEALNEHGKGSDIKGVIMDDSGNIITTFESLHDGMGTFKVNYKEGAKYQARITSPDIDRAFYLPEKQSVASLSLIKRSNESLSFRINGSDANYLLAGYSRGKLVYETGLLDRNSIDVHTDSLPTGIIRFVLKDTEGAPLSERMVFVNKGRSMQIDITPKQEKFEPGGKVSLEIQTRNPEGQPTSMKLGLAVVDDQLIALADDKSDHILSYFYLSSELKGEINEPYFYFDPEEDKADEALDQLMLVKGWSNYSWNKLDSGIILYPPEQIRLITGRLVNKSGAPAQGYVYAMEKTEGQRMIKVKTTSDGHFVIKNFNAASELYLFTKKPNKLVVRDDRAIVPAENKRTYPWWYEDFNYYNDEIIFDSFEMEGGVDQQPDQDTFDQSFDMSLDSDVQQLSEVVVTGYGYEEKNNITSCVVRIRGIQTDHFGSVLELQGKVNGILIANKNTDMAVASGITFSKAKSLASGNGEPLIVLNGIELSPSVSRNFLNSELFTPEQIESITFMDAPDAIMQYGGKAANGVIFFESKRIVSHYAYSYETKNGKYNGVIITSRKFSLVRDEYQISRKPGNDQDTNTRKYVDYLVYWNPEIITDKEGKAEISFLANDNVSNFKITAEGISVDGNIGRGEGSYYTEQPVSLDIKLPNQIGFEDKVLAQAIITNETDKKLDAELLINANGLHIEFDKKLVLQPGSKKTIPILITSTGTVGKFKLNIDLSAGRFSDHLEKSLIVYPIGFPTTLSHSGSNPNGRFRFKPTNPEEGSLKTEITIYPTVISQLESSAEALFREPHGCFEQVSSTTYPSILALRYLESSGKGDAATRKKALNYIKIGYDKLMSYEIRGGGFEWFGHSPAHEGLTAFGLVEFTQMKHVFEGMDPAMITRTISWLMSKRDGSGGFVQSHGKYGFASASKEVNNAYIVYALTEAGEKDIALEYQKALDESKKSNDFYRMALMANAAYNLGDMRSYEYLVSNFKNAVNSKGIDALPVEHSLVRSYGNNLSKEVVSLWTLALLKDADHNMVFISNLIQFLLENNSKGYYGSTQATTLSLQAITEYNLRLATESKSGTIEIWVNGAKRSELFYYNYLKEPLQARDLSEYLSDSTDNVVELKFPYKDSKLPYSISVKWLDKEPKTNKDAPIQLSTELKSSHISRNETVRLMNRVSNADSTGKPMAIARIGIPGGLSLQTQQLKELQEKGVFDYYELINEDLVLYFTELGPKQTVEIPLDLKAEIPGQFKARASSAYIYYSDDDKYWVPGVEVDIKE